MTQDQIVIIIIGTATVAMFLWGRWRHDIVAACALLACVLAGLIDPAAAFAGFGHPAVITVACVLVLSRGLQASGAVDVLARTVLPASAGRVVSMAALIGLGALLSGVMNNVGAMALLMPVAMQLAKRLELVPGQVLMPLAFGTILGGMTTLIGTPPNLIVSGFREQAGEGGFGMFDFTPVGLSVAVAGVVFVALVGWRLVPARKRAGIEGFESGAYLTEVFVPADSKADGRTMRQLEEALEESGAQLVGLVRSEMRVTAPNPWQKVRVGDVLVIEAEAEGLASVVSSQGLRLEEAKKPEDADETTARNDEHGGGTTAHSGKGAEVAQNDGTPDYTKDNKSTKPDRENDEKTESSNEVALMELVVMPGSMLTGLSAKDILLRTRYGLNMLALSRQGDRSLVRLRAIGLRPGDLLLMQGPPDALSEFAADYGCVPLAARELRVPTPRMAWQAGLIMAFAVAGAAFGLLPAAISFAIGVVASMVLRTVPPRAVYNAIDWPVIVLLGALIPVAGAMETTGTADLIARLLLDYLAQDNAVVALALILIVTMFLSDLMNNAATAAIMCPIAIGTAATLGVSADSFLMAVAIGASCAFLTPIGHQNNTLILGPGGFRFGDYWKLGLPLEILVTVISIPLLLIVWPL